LGESAGAAVTTGGVNTFIGYGSNPTFSGSAASIGGTVAIGTNAIRFYAPASLEVSSSVTRTILEASHSSYSGFVMDYNIEAPTGTNSADQRAGTYWASFTSGSFVTNEQTTADIGDTTGFQFSGSVTLDAFRLSIVNKSGNTINAYIHTSFRMFPKTYSP